MKIKRPDRPRDSAPPGRPAEGCGCRSWSWPDRFVRAVAEWCGFRCRKEDQGIHRLVLGGGSDVCAYGEVGQERFDFSFGGEEVLTGLHAVKTNKPHDPVHVGSLGVNGVVVQTEYLSDLIKEF